MAKIAFSALLTDFYAFDPNFNRGVHVGTLGADLHGTPAAIVGPRQGFVPLVKSFDLKSMEINRQLLRSTQTSGAASTGVEVREDRAD
jgi:hypothetical protein